LLILLEINNVADDVVPVGAVRTVASCSQANQNGITRWLPSPSPA
jgi:hypothetical protein